MEKVSKSVGVSAHHTYTYIYLIILTYAGAELVHIRFTNQFEQSEAELNVKKRLPLTSS